MKTLKFIAFLFYRYYSSGRTSNIAYFSTLIVMTLFSYIHLLQVLVLIRGTKILPQGHKGEIITWIKMGLFLLPLFLLFRLLIKESEIKQMDKDNRSIKAGNIWLVIYMISSMILLIALIEMNKR